MTIETWPPDLPPPNISGYQQARQNARRGRSAQNGPPKWSRRFSSVAEVVAMSMSLTIEQLAIFDQFFAETLVDGTKAFWMRDPVRDGRQLADETGRIITDEADAPILITVTRLCAWGAEPPRMMPIGYNDVRVDFNVVYLP